MKSSSCVLNLCVLNWLYKYIEISWISKYIEDVAQRTSDNSKYQIWLIRYQKCENKRGCLLRAFMLKKILREIFSILLDFFKKFFCNKKCIGYWQFLTKKKIQSRHLATLASLKWTVFACKMAGFQLNLKIIFQAS